MLALLLLAGGWAIPFQFESFSILYKFGAEKAMLRGGKVIGITGVVLVFFQLVLASRFTFMERTFSPRRLLFLHRMTGMAIGTLVVLHPLLIKGSEQFTPYTLEKKYYPEFLGFAVATVLLVLILTAMLRNFFKLSYQGWLLQHRISSTLLLVLLPAHVLLVSESFKSGPPRSAALVIFSFTLLLLARIWLRRIHRQAEPPNGQRSSASGTGPG